MGIQLPVAVARMQFAQNFCTLKIQDPITIDDKYESLIGLFDNITPFLPIVWC